MPRDRIDGPAPLPGTSPERMRVDRWMARNVVTIRRSATVQAARTLMTARRIRHLPVVDSDDRLVGIVTDRDLRQVIFDPALHERVAELAQLLAGLTVDRIMTAAVVTVAPGAPIRDAARLMHERRIGALPVIEGVRVVGILTESDVVRAFLELLGHPIPRSVRAVWPGRMPRPYAGPLPMTG
jgi:acetoin utilization protein AcuB